MPILSHTPICCRKRNDDGVSEEHRFEYASPVGVFEEDRSCESIRAILRPCVDGCARSAETSESPAGPPPTHTRSYISGPASFAGADAVAVDQKLRRIAGGRSRKRLAAHIEPFEAVLVIMILSVCTLRSMT